MDQRREAGLIEDAPLVAAVRAVDAEADRDPVWNELFTIRPEIKNSQLTLLDRPGWGFELDEQTLERRGVWA